MINRLLDPNPVSRFTMAQVQQHAWLREDCSSELNHSYLSSDFDKFLLAHKLKLKPKHAKDVNEDILCVLEQMTT